jgi:hypothetical protein
MGLFLSGGGRGPAPPLLAGLAPGGRGAGRAGTAPLASGGFPPRPRGSVTMRAARESAQAGPPSAGAVSPAGDTDPERPPGCRGASRAVRPPDRDNDRSGNLRSGNRRGRGGAGAGGGRGRGTGERGAVVVMQGEQSHAGVERLSAASQNARDCQSRPSRRGRRPSPSRRPPRRVPAGWRPPRGAARRARPPARRRGRPGRSVPGRRRRRGRRVRGRGALGSARRGGSRP